MSDDGHTINLGPVTVGTPPRVGWTPPFEGTAQRGDWDTAEFTPRPGSATDAMVHNLGLIADLMKVQIDSAARLKAMVEDQHHG